MIKRDDNFEKIDISSIKTVYTIIKIILIIIGSLGFIGGLTYLILGATNGIGLGIVIGIVIMVFDPLFLVVIWCFLKPIFGLLYDIKLLRYKVVDENKAEESKDSADDSSQKVEQPKQENKKTKKNFEDLVFNDTITYESLNGTYNFENTYIVIYDKVCKIMEDNNVFMKGVVIIEGNQVVLVSDDWTRKKTLIKVGNDLKASNGIIYKKIASK